MILTEKVSWQKLRFCRNREGLFQGHTLDEIHFWQSYIAYQIQFVIRRVLYDEEVYGISTSRRPTMIEQLILNVDNAVTSSVLIPSQQGFSK
ncbi:Oidioi.mRNA.OKI2018_I69.chr1.g3753.t1.cds [Oikopleura dioica]|uniref:Oidioi.mRNA.OKI2018_I69.chr1.g3753.t1.cds n=1 Tax=Oikopleura dioica TaxID=34765 RepID=A0ABN7T0N7_OIKDI|nr:Oidioi.mRNA.OKI2018_I69.chr1.g3753.t1.cds [Oikopleura dioica]